RREPLRVVPAGPPDLVRRSVEDVENIGRLAIADFDADGIDEDELVDPVAARNRELRRQPAAERKADQRRLLPRQVFENLQVEMHEVVYRVEILGPRGMAKARSGRCDHLALPGEKIDKARFG